MKRPPSPLLYASVAGTLAACAVSCGPAPDTREPALARSFELIYHSSDSAFDNRTHFKEADDLAQWSTPQRIQYLRLLAQRLTQQDRTQLEAQVVNDKMIEETLDNLRPIPETTVRRRLSLVYWKWQIDVEAAAEGYWSVPEFDDGHWNHARLPFVRETDADLWLRTRVTPPSFIRAVLELEQVLDQCSIWVNGKLAARHEGYEPFEVDVTSLLQPGVPNTIALKIPFKPGEQVGPGGYARLAFVGRQRIVAPFTYTRDIEVRENEPGEALQVVRCQIENTAQEPFEGHLIATLHRWADTTSEEGTLSSAPLTVPPGQQIEAQLELNILKARLWTPDQPDLYKVTLVLRDSTGRDVDDTVVVTGIRSVAVKGNRITLNNRRFFMVGFSDMLTYPPRSLASTHSEVAPADAMIIRAILTAKLANANTIRLHPLGMRTTEKEIASGLPAYAARTDATNYRRIAEIADQLGIALIWPTRFWGAGASFLENDKEKELQEQLPASIRAVRNHPSIIGYEGMNEVGFALRPKKDQPPGPERRSLLSRYQRIRRAYVQTVTATDPTRLINPDSNWVQWDAHSRELAPFLPESTSRDSQNVYATLHMYQGWDHPISSIWTLPFICDPTRRALPVVVNELGSEAMPNWSHYRDHLWYGVWVNNTNRYCSVLEKNAIGRPLNVLEDSEYLLSQAYQALLIQLYGAAVRNYDGDGFVICTMSDGFAMGHYHKGVVDIYNRRKLGWTGAGIVMNKHHASGQDGDFVIGPSDTLKIRVSSISHERQRGRILKVRATTQGGSEFARKQYSLPDFGFGVLDVAQWQPAFPGDGFYFVEYDIR